MHLKRDHDGIAEITAYVKLNSLQELIHRAVSVLSVSQFAQLLTFKHRTVELRLNDTNII